jgi:glyoxylase-like metal-dependent hydrolase (beta-lactamase superfamily II)
LIEQWAPGLWLAQSRFEQTNSGAFVCRGQACLIDPGVYPGEIAAWQRAVRAHGWTPRALVLTHHHWDHILGPEGFPGVPIVAHAAYLAAVGGPEGAPAVERWAAKEGIARAMSFVVPLPDQTFEGALSLIVGDRRLELFHAPGHAPDQLVVYDPARATLWAADMLSDREIPFVSHNLAAYQQTLARLSSFDLRRLIPGHGRPAADARQIRARLDADRAYLAELRARVEQAVREGRPVDATVAFCAGMRFRRRETMAELHRLNVESAYLELGGEADPAQVGWGALGS